MKKPKSLNSIIRQGNFSEREIKLIENAYNFAEEEHKGQIKGKILFFNHPAYVGYLIAKWKQGGEAVCAGLLHDVVEDSGVELSEIREKFGEKVVFYVDGMSYFRKKINGQLIKDYEGQFKKFSRYVMQDPILAIVKAGDEMSRSDPKSAKRVIESLKEKGLWKDYQTMINERMRGFWIPFFKEIGFSKVAKKIELKGKFVREEKSHVNLFDYFSKKELTSLKSRLRRVKGIRELWHTKKDEKVYFRKFAVKGN